MKKLTMMLIALFLFSGISFANKKKLEKERAAIIEVIEDGTKAYYGRDIKIMDTYVQDESTTRLGIGKNGYNLVKGWSKLDAGYKNNFKNNPNPVTMKYKKVNYQIRVYKDAAWAIHDQLNTNAQGNETKQIIVHFLEKVEGKWKISYINVIGASSYE